MEKAFNLILEKWVLVMRDDFTVEEVSLRDALAHAHEYRSLAGELPTQDVALMRLLLAVLYAVFLRRSPDGEISPITENDEEDVTADDAIERWKQLWEMGVFPMEVIDAYFDEYKDRFWLIHPERPFYQVAHLDVGTDYGTPKLNGELSESANKRRLFPNITGKAKERLTYPEAARWLPYVIAFDDTSAKPKQKGLGSPGAGWLGKLGLIYAQGKSLFQTLMLNFSLLMDAEKLWQDEPPTWELDRPRTQERSEIALPQSPMALYTLQSRRITLLLSEEYVVGYRLLGGDYFDKMNAFSEQMTLWGRPSDKKLANEYQPKRHQAGKQMWREFSTMLGDDTMKAGIVRWGSLLRRKRILKSNVVTYNIASVQYGDKDFFVTRVFEDSLSFSLDLLTELGEAWRKRIEAEVAKADELAKHLGWLMSDLQKAGNSKATDAAYAKEIFYFRLDMPFRHWLLSIDPNADVSMTDKVLQWRKEEERILLDLARELVDDAGHTTFVGKYVTEENKDPQLFCAPKAYRIFIGRTYKCLKE